MRLGKGILSPIGVPYRVVEHVSGLLSRRLPLPGKGHDLAIGVQLGFLDRPALRWLSFQFDWYVACGHGFENLPCQTPRRCYGLDYQGRNVPLSMQHMDGPGSTSFQFSYC